MGIYYTICGMSNDVKIGDETDESQGNHGDYPQSPLGQQLMGRKVGHRWTTKLGGSLAKYHIVSVS